MASTLVRLTAQEIEERRRALLAEAGMSAEELRERADVWALTQAQSAILDALEDLDFLLQP